MHDGEYNGYWIGGRADHPKFIGLAIVFKFLQAQKMLRLEGCTASASRIEMQEGFLQIPLARTSPRGDLRTHGRFLGRSEAS